MNKSYRSIFNEQTGTYVAAPEIAKTSGKKNRLGAVASTVKTLIFTGALTILANLGMVAYNNVQAQILPETPCITTQANVPGSMWAADVQCVNYVNNTR